MADFLSALGTLTLGGSAAIGVLALTARFSRARYAAQWRCWVWLILCLRLMIPGEFTLPEQSRVAPPIQITAPSDTVIYTYEPVQPPVQTAPELPKDELPVVVPEQPAAPEQPVERPVQSREVTLFDALGLVWLIGAAGMLGWYALSHLRFLRHLRRWGGPVVNAQTIRLYNELGDLLELDRRPDLYTCAGLSVPVLAGLFHQKLLLPEGEMAEDELRCSLLHELTHFKRRDIWLKTLALAANAIHWFNPFMWYMTRLVERDTELACDEAALKKLPAEEHGAYGRTILDAVERLKNK